MPTASFPGRGGSLICDFGSFFFLFFFFFAGVCVFFFFFFFCCFFFRWQMQEEYESPPIGAFFPLSPAEAS